MHSSDGTDAPAAGAEATTAGAPAATEADDAAWGQEPAPEAVEEAPAEETLPGPQEYERQAREALDDKTGTVPYVDHGGNPTK